MSRIILAIESSCDETACAIIDEDYKVYSSVVSTQIDVHRLSGGVIPEVASRMHTEVISYVIKKALDDSGLKMDDIDVIAYTAGPGLIGSLHIGGVAAKTLAFFYNKPLIAIHHLKGHIFINNLVRKMEYPLLAMIVSGGHTELVIMKDDNSYDIIGTTLDDAVGEAFDKVARVMGLEYPGGPKIDALAKLGKHRYDLPTPKVDGYNFSFSGLKNATIQIYHKAMEKGEEIVKEDLAYDFQETALNFLMNKALKALEEYDVKMVVLAGGVACNSRLRALAEEKISSCDLILPPLKYTTDNALMIACAAVTALKHEQFVGFDHPSRPYIDLA